MHSFQDEAQAAKDAVFFLLIRSRYRDEIVFRLLYNLFLLFFQFETVEWIREEGSLSVPRPHFERCYL